MHFRSKTCILPDGCRKVIHGSRSAPLRRHGARDAPPERPEARDRSLHASRRRRRRSRVRANFPGLLDLVHIQVVRIALVTICPPHFASSVDFCSDIVNYV